MIKTNTTHASIAVENSALGSRDAHASFKSRNRRIVLRRSNIVRQDERQRSIEKIMKVASTLMAQEGVVLNSQ